MQTHPPAHRVRGGLSPVLFISAALTINKTGDFKNSSVLWSSNNVLTGIMPKVFT